MPLSEYEKLRARNIARNNIKLEFLGLGSDQLQSQPQIQGQTQPRTRTQRQKRKRAAPAPTVVRRRSTRIATIESLQGAPSYTDVTIHEESSSLPSRARQRAKHTDSAFEPTGIATSANAVVPLRKRNSSVKHKAKTTKNTSKTTASSNPNSSKNLKANTALLLSEEYLGRQIARLGGQVKGAVMYLAASPRIPRFSRMSGIQEW